VRWDAALLYDLSNVAQAGAHVVMAAVLGRHSWRRRDSRLTRLLVWPLFLFFLTGIYVHVMNAVDSCGEMAWRLAWSHAGRAALVCLGVVPFCWLGVRGMALLPTKEEYRRALAEKDAALAQAEAARAGAEAAARTEADLRRVAENTARRIGRQTADLRGEIERLRSQIQNEDLYRRLRVGFHEINDAAAQLPRTG
jgi:hypothetical protein